MTFAMCVLMHILTNYMAVRSVKMESLNRPRLLHILASWFSNSSVPDITETNIKEPLFWGPAFIAGRWCFVLALKANSMKRLLQEKTYLNGLVLAFCIFQTSQEVFKVK